MSYYRCSNCGSERIFITFFANYLGTVKIGSIDEIRKKASVGGIDNIRCADCYNEIELDERAENEKKS